MKTLKFAPDLVPLILNGSKTSTWKLFDDKDLTEGDELSLVNKESGEEFAKVKVTSIKQTTLGELTDQGREGYEPFESDEQAYARKICYHVLERGNNVNIRSYI